MSRPGSTLPHLVRDGLNLNPDFSPSSTTGARGILRLPGPNGRSIWIVSRYAGVREVLGDHERFSSADFEGVGGRTGESIGTGSDAPSNPPVDRQSGSLLATDPPQHTRLRRMLSAEFTVKRIRWIEPRITEIVDRCLNDMQEAGAPTELVSTFALPVPSLVICELLGVPYTDRDRFQRRTARATSNTVSQAELDEVARESHEYMGSLVDHARTDPGDDILGMLVREHGNDLTRTELINIADLLLFAGHETTANMLGLGTLALLQHPDQLAQLRSEPALVGPAVEELLRYLSVLQMTVPRTATRDSELMGETISAGDLVMVSLPAANRDPDLLEDPETFDVRRRPVSHLAFGHGIHYCLGAQLARAEMRIAWPALLQRFPSLALDPNRDVEYRPPNVFYGLAALPVTW